MSTDSTFVQLEEPAEASSNQTPPEANQANATPQSEAPSGPQGCDKFRLGLAFCLSCGLTACYKPKTSVGHGNPGSAL